MNWYIVTGQGETEGIRTIVEMSVLCDSSEEAERKFLKKFRDGKVMEIKYGPQESCPR